MKQKRIIAVVIGIVIVAVAAGVFYSYQEKRSSNEFGTQWIASGPFAISQPKYRLGENIFLSVHGLKPNEVGNILIIQPNGNTWTTIPFNGTSKSDFNYYNKPDTSAAKKLYKPEDLVGTWKVVFQGVKYEPLTFEIVSEFVPGAENDIVPINRNATEKVGPDLK